MKHPTQKIVSLALSLVLVLCLLPVTVFAAPVYEVSTADELAAALSGITSGGEFIISLTADITVTSATFNKSGSTVTIVGNGHTIQMSQRSHVNVSNGTVLNLGDGNSSLTIKGTTYNDEPGLIYVDSATLNMYDKVTLRDNQTSNYHGGGVTMQGGTFNMYGGVIDNCGVLNGSNSFGGGVSVNSGGLFNMYGGEIKNCYANTTYKTSNPGLIPSGAGGGVVVFKGSTFNLKGGIITDCSASESGGGVAVIASLDSYYTHGSKFGFVDSEFNMSGGSITNNTAGILGGGIFISGYYAQIYSMGIDPYSPGYPSNPGMTISGGEITGNNAETGGGIIELTLNNDSLANSISDGVLLCNNIASYDGSDIYLSGCTLTLPAAAKMSSVNYANSLPSDVSGKPIQKWFEDYNPNDGGTRYINLAPEKREDALVDDGTVLTADNTGDIALIAAPSPFQYTVTFEMNGHGTAIAPQTVASGESAKRPEAPTAEGFTFGGWYTDADCSDGKLYSFSDPVTEDITLYAKWEAEKEYTVTFDMNGHGTAIAPKTVASGKTVERPEDPTAEGFTFGGWYEDSTFSKLFDFSTAITKNVTIYAKWSKAEPETATLDISAAFAGLLGKDFPKEAAISIQSSDGSFNRTYPISSFTFNSTSGQYEKTLTVPAGTYTVTESNYAVNGYKVHVSSTAGTTGGDTITVTIGAGNHSSVTISNAYIKNPEDVKKDQLDASPKTGDARQTALWIGMLTAAFGTAGAAIYIEKKKYNA